MGNTESNVTSGVKNQAGVSTQLLYKLVNLKGGGMLVDMMKRAAANKQFAEIDHAIKTKVEPFLYNKGACRYVPKSAIVYNRNRERPRHKQLPDIRIIENLETDFNIDNFIPEISTDEYMLNPELYREVCWDLKVRQINDFNVCCKVIYNMLSYVYIGTRCCWRINFAFVSPECYIFARRFGQTITTILSKVNK